MNSTPIDLILRQSYLHLVSYGLVTAILFVALADAYVIGHLRKVLRLESGQLRRADVGEVDLAGMVHPLAGGLDKGRKTVLPVSSASLRRRVELADAELFVPLRSRITLTRDLSTLMGLIATLLALVAAAADFARNGKPELLVGSVGTGCVATCVAAVGCAMALWNLSRLTRLRLQVACESEEAILELCDCDLVAVTAEEFIQPRPRHKTVVQSQPDQNHAPL